MAVLIDTNVVLDWILKRGQFVEPAVKIMRHCANNAFKGYLALHSLLNIFYITRNDFRVAQRQEILLMLYDYFKIVNIDRRMVMVALKSSNLKDLEDDLQLRCAIKANVDYIITRDVKGFADSAIEILSPEDFLQILEGDI
ncbi:MAG: PIN domain-containing protein [Clostridiales bacterium]|nr:PIN domain-containing protein [Clostridiales bacterium]